MREKEKDGKRKGDIQIMEETTVIALCQPVCVALILLIKMSPYGCSILIEFSTAR